MGKSKKREQTKSKGRVAAPAADPIAEVERAEKAARKAAKQAAKEAEKQAKAARKAEKRAAKEAEKQAKAARKAEKQAKKAAAEQEQAAKKAAKKAAKQAEKQAKAAKKQAKGKQGKKKKKKKGTALFAVLHEGDVEGEGVFWASDLVAYEPGDDRDALLAKMPNAGDPDWLERARPVARGAWVVDQRIADVIKLVSSAGFLGRDSYLYGRNAALQALAREHAVERLVWEGAT